VDKNVTFVRGNGFCRYMHVIQDLFSFGRSAKLAGIDHRESQIASSAKEDYQWRNEELGIYFRRRPTDPAWKNVSPPIADSVQDGFLEICELANLDQYDDTNELPKDVIDVICEVANDVGERNKFNPAFIILVTHQYVDADRQMRQMYKTRWVAFMVSRSPYAPPPESYLDYITAQYFSDS
jgi:hypothetical protein